MKPADSTDLCSAPILTLTDTLPCTTAHATPAPCLQARRAVSAMSETERKLNAKLLREMEAAGAAGGIPAVRGSPVRSP